MGRKIHVVPELVGGGKADKEKDKWKGGGKADKNKLDPNRCYKCGKVTDPPHKAADCPERRAAAANAGSGSDQAAQQQPQQQQSAAPQQQQQAGQQTEAKLRDVARAMLVELSAGSGSSMGRAAAHNLPSSFGGPRAKRRGAQHGC